MKAAIIDQSSLFNALSNLYQTLSLYLENSSSDCSTCTSSNDHTNDNIKNDRDGGDNVDTDDIKKEVEEDAYEIDKTKETKKGGINDITRTNHDTDTTDTDTRIDTQNLLRHVTSSLLQLELVRTRGALSKTQRTYNIKLTNVWLYVEYEFRSWLHLMQL